MNKKISTMFQPSMRLYFLILIVFAVVTFFFSPQSKVLAAGEIGVIILVAVYTKISNRRRQAKLIKYIESVTDDMDSASKDSLANSPLPVMIFSPRDELIFWTNRKFMEISGEREHFFELRMADIVPGFSGKWLLDGKNECPDLVSIGEKKYRVFGSIIRTERERGVHEFLATTYWIDMTEFAEIHSEFLNSRPITAVIVIDNYDELLKKITDKEKSAVLSNIDDKISDWTGGIGGQLCKYDRDRYFFIFEERYLKKFTDDKFSLLDSVHEVVGSSGVHATLSIGIGKDGESYDENFKFASLGIEMALSRGGDQAVIKNRFNFEFFGGQSEEFEKRTKVKSRVMANAFGELVGDASSIFVMGHKCADLDTVGAAVGVSCIARSRGKKAKIVIDLKNNASQSLIEKLKKLPEYADAFVSSQDAILEADSETLLVVVDTNRPEQVESETLLMSCNRVAVIDHHRRAATYIENAALNFHEPYASSACELVTEMIQYLVDQSVILRIEAEALLSGIVLDTKSFGIRTGSRTFDAAAFLRRMGADTTEVKRLLQSDLKTALSRYDIIRSARIYREGIAIATSSKSASRVIVAQSADELLNIAGVQASFVACPSDEDIFVSGRSIGNVNVQLILEQMGGGGNKSTAGVQLKGTTMEDALLQLKAAIDKYFDDLKLNSQH